MSLRDIRKEREKGREVGWASKEKTWEEEWQEFLTCFEELTTCGERQGKTKVTLTNNTQNLPAN